MTFHQVDPNLALTANSSLTDEEVVERVRAGDTPLYEIIMRRHNQRLFRIARAILGNSDEAEDVMQHAYVRGLCGASSICGPVSIFDMARPRLRSTRLPAAS